VEEWRRAKGRREVGGSTCTATWFRRLARDRYLVVVRAIAHGAVPVEEIFFFLKFKPNYIKQASRLIKNLPVPLGTLVRKRVCKKLAASSSKNSYIINYISQNRKWRITIPKKKYYQNYN
jgi:hypothetical protein